MNEETQRRRIARLARGLLDGVVEYDLFATAAFEANQDDEIDELADLITHMPKCGGFGGLSKEQYERYLERLHGMIRKLEA